MASFIKIMLLFSICLASTHADFNSNFSQAAASRQIDEWQYQYNRYIFETLKHRTSGCTTETLQYRREWSSLAKSDRIEYTTAVRCLQTKPNLISNTRVPGARTRYDDFVATHISQAPFIHNCGTFLHWHRYYTYLYDKLLRSECGYTGPQPYWDWTLSYEDPLTSKIFDGSVDSMGSNGKSVPHPVLNISAFGIHFPVPPATGGGCVYAGPFTDYVVNLGPTAFEPRVGDGSGLDYNPRCLKRDVSFPFANTTKPTDVVALVSGNDNLEAFSGFFQLPAGLHNGGHYTIGGDPGADPYVSPGDPIFFLHHGQVDRLWTIWQALAPRTRFGEVFGTSTAYNNPPSPNVTQAFELQFDVLAKPQTIASVDSTIDGPFCYIYV